MTLGFKPQFKQPILDGTKIHTIREDVNERWNEGNTIQFATGVRTKNYNQFKQDTCKGIQFVFMTYHWTLEISIGDTHYCDKYLTPVEIEKFAINDGFKNRTEFENWFVPLIKSNKDELYKGTIIHWTDFKY